MTAKREPRTPNEKSVFALSVFLGHVIEAPRKHAGDTRLRVALRRQSRLASYQNSAFGIEPLSHSTVCRLAENVIDGGFAFLDSLRVTALQRIEEEVLETNKARRRSKSRLSEDLEAAKRERVQGLVDLWHLTTAFHKALTAGRRLANRSGKPGMVELWDSDEKKLLAMFDLASRAVVEIGSDTEKWLERLRQL